MVAAIGVEHPLHDDLAPLVLEIDVDVGRLAPLLRDEALEQQIVALRIDRGDAEHVADGAVGGRAAALTENVLAAGEADDRVHGQEVWRIAQRLDQAQLVLEDCRHLVGHAFGIARGSAFPGELFERLLRRQARHGRLFGILIGEFVEREAAAFGDLDRACQRLGIAAEEPRHFVRRFEIAVGMALAAKAGVIDGAVVPDAGHHILQDAPRRNMEQHIIGDDGRHARPRRQVRQFMEAQRIVRPPAQGQRHIGAVAESLGEPAQVQRAGLIGLIGHEHRDQPLAIGDEVGPIETALRLAAALLAKRKQPAEARIGGPVGRIDEDGHAVGEIEAAADDQAHARCLGGFMGADDAGEAVAIDDGERLDAELCGLGEQFLAGTRPAQKTEMRGALQLGIARGAHPKIPCRNQRCAPVVASSPSPAR